jgi:hypothetical protein
MKAAGTHRGRPQEARIDRSYPVAPMDIERCSIRRLAARSAILRTPGSFQRLTGVLPRRIEELRVQVSGWLVKKSDSGDNAIILRVRELFRDRLDDGLCSVDVGLLGGPVGRSTSTAIIESCMWGRCYHTVVASLRHHHIGGKTCHSGIQGHLQEEKNDESVVSHIP